MCDGKETKMKYVVKWSWRFWNETPEKVIGVVPVADNLAESCDANDTFDDYDKACDYADTLKRHKEFPATYM